MKLQNRGLQIVSDMELNRLNFFLWIKEILEQTLEHLFFISCILVLISSIESILSSTGICTV